MSADAPPLGLVIDDNLQNREVAEGHAMAMLVLILLSIPITLVGLVHEAAALMLAGAGGGGAFLSALGQPQRDALAYLALELHVRTIFVACWTPPAARS